MSNPFVRGVDMEMLRQTWQLLRMFEAGFVDDAEKARADKSGGDEAKDSERCAMAWSREFGRSALVVRDALAALEWLAERPGDGKVPSREVSTSPAGLSNGTTW